MEIAFVGSKWQVDMFKLERGNQMVSGTKYRTYNVTENDI